MGTDPEIGFGRIAALGPNLRSGPTVWSWQKDQDLSHPNPSAISCVKQGEDGPKLRPASSPLLRHHGLQPQWVSEHVETAAEQ